MSATTTPDAPADQPAQAAPMTGARRRRSPLWIALWILLGMFVAAIALAVFLVAAGDETVSTSPEAAVEPIADAGADDIVTDFARAWSGGDWATVAQLSNETVAATAREWYVDGIEVAIVTPLSDTGGELLVSDPSGGSALIFAITVTDEPELRVTDLVFNGDAG